MHVPSWVRDALLKLGETAIALAAGILVGAAIMWLSGYNPWEAYRYLLESSILDTYSLTMTLSFAAPVMLTGITFAVGVRAGLFNIGAEGQLYMGALGAVLVAYAARSGLGFLDSPLGTVAALLAGVALASLWGLAAALLKVRRGVHEVVSTIMLNWIAFWLTEYMRVYVVYDPHDPSKTVSVPPGARLPLLARGTELSASLLISLGFTLFTYVLLWHMVHGYELRAAGLNPRAARYGGISVERMMVLAFLVGAVAAGLAGAGEVLGRPPHYAITTGLSNLAGLGFDGITVALIGANHPLGIIGASVLVGALKAGAKGMQIYAHVPLEMVRIVEGVIIIALAVPGTLRLILEYRRRRLELARVEKAGSTMEGAGSRA
ncbi:nucleoside ABC transporter membrane protein [Pyrodictium delaneyi]|uniref:ABC transporter permease n=1 Tax=Pyrodictium delaneyi TaxID=1273541 RepID=A0A0P0N2Z4_9CREN|nr:ABC transporter permease [Pyrodictium delaneyi]ALL00931.1 nucleoside ABC transporter membrane protein [Pyrodictium delaneyi]OWJ55454.1 ABC transporter permease [Pyrodictium delaneyi]